MSAPVIVFAYKRADKLRACLKALSEADGRKGTQVFIFTDCAKDVSEEKDVSEVAEVIDDFVQLAPFERIHVKKRNRHIGLADNVISGVTEVINTFYKVIVIEDDLIISADFLTYMNQALEFYENEDNIWSVTGFCEPLKSLKKYQYDVFYGYRGCSYGWGTWKNRWEAVVWEVREYQTLLQDKKTQRLFNRGGNDMTNMLKNQMEGRIDSWAIRWCFSQSMQDKYTVYPSKSLVINTGTDGSGTHGAKIEGINENLHKYGEIIELVLTEPNRAISREFYIRHSDTLTKKIRRNLEWSRVMRLIGRLIIRFF